MKRLIFALLLRTALLLPNPPRPPMKTCGNCGRGNEPIRTQCWNCGAQI